MGQSLVEFAIFVPVLAVILLMAVDLGRVYLGWVTLSNVARIGANYAAANPTGWVGSGDADIQARYRELMGKDAGGINCSLPSTLPGPVFVDASQAIGSRVRVDLTCTFVLFTPIISNLVGDGSGNLVVGTSASFAVRMGSFDSATVFDPTSWPTPTPTPSPTPSPSPTPTPAPTPTPDPSATPGPTGTPTPTEAPLDVSFYGIPTSSDSWGGGPPGSEDEEQIVGVPNLAVTFYNTTVGTQGSCRWDFGDGTESTACSNTVPHTYTAHGTYTVILTVDGQTVTRVNYVTTTCKVPAFAGVRAFTASSVWVAAGFSSSNITILDGTGNYKIGYQSLAGGLVNPPGGCAATIEVGP